MTRYVAQLGLPICHALLIRDNDLNLLTVDLFDDQASCEQALNGLLEQGAQPSSLPEPIAKLYVEFFQGAPSSIDRLNLQGTDFQRRGWAAIASIPAGEVRSYSELAAMLGQPTAARAVASACARNTLALLVPCHRVVPASGGVGQYRWGSALKERLLRYEAGLKAL